MSWLMLILGSGFALAVVNAWRPVRRNRFLLLASFAAAWLTIEAAPVWLVVLSASWGILVRAGALDQRLGWFGLALVAASWMRLVALWRQGRATTTAAAAAMGPAVKPAMHPDSGGSRRCKVRVDRNIGFRKVGGKRLRLDVYRPSEPPAAGLHEVGPRPAIMQIHGGAWVIGDKREQGVPLLRYLASRGWVGFNVNYRLSPGATFPEHLIDLKAALAWIRANAGSYGIDPGFVVVTGGSAGGHLAALMALTAGDPAYQPGFEQADTSVQAAVPFYGVYDFTNRNGTFAPHMRERLLEPLVMKAFYADEPEAFRLASPVDRVHPEAPPFLIIHGDLDTLAPVEDARYFAERLRDASSAEVAYLELHGAEHAFDVFTSPRTRRTVRVVEQFLSSVRTARAHQGGGLP